MSRKKTILFSTLLLTVASIAFILYFVLIFRAESSLQRFVKSQSKGKLNLEVQKVRLDIFHLRFDFRNVDLLTIDSSNTISGYHVKSERISFEVHSLFSVFSDRRFIIDSVIVRSPLIEVIKYKEGPQRKISLPDEMSKVYESLEKILKVLNLNYLHVSDAKFIVQDLSKPHARPLQLSNIYLTINNVSEESQTAKNRFLHADRILLEIYNQDILLPDGYHGIKFKRFWMGTRSRTIKLDSCYVYGKSRDTSAAEFNVFIDSLRIKKLDFNALAKENTIKFDSAICINPDINIKLHIKEKNAKGIKLTGNEVISRDSIDHKLKKMLGNLELGYIGVKNASEKISIQKNDKINVFKSRNDNFSISNLVVSDKSNVPIQLGQFEIEVHDYTAYSHDSLDIIKFDKISVQDKKITLHNFSLHPSKTIPGQLRREMKMQSFELDDINWSALLYQNKIAAGHASLIKPEIHLILPESDRSKTSDVKTNPFEMLSKLREKVEIGEFYIENGSVKIEQVNGISLSVDNCYAGINVDQLLRSENALRATDAVDTFSFSKGSFDNRSIKLLLKNGNYSRHSNSVYFGLVQETKKGLNSGITLKDIKLQGLNLHSTGDISASKLSWKEADISINMLRNENDKTKTKKTGTNLKLTISKLQGGPTSLYFIGDNIEASTQVNQVTTDEIILEPGRNPIINGLNIDGRLINLHQNKVQGNIGGYNIRDKNISTIENVKVILPVGRETISLFIPRFVFSADINQSINGKLTASYMELHQPVISFLPQQTGDEIKQEADEGKLPLLNIGRITIFQPELSGLPASISEKLKFDPGNMNLNIIRINSDSESVKIDSISVSAVKPFFASENIRLNPTGNEKIDLFGSAFEIKPATQQAKSQWTFNLNALKLSGLQMNTLKDDSIKQTITLNNLNLENLQVNDSSFKNPEEFISTNNRFRISNGNIGLENSKSKLGIHNLSLIKATNSLSLDSISFSPVLDRETFMKTQDYQATHIRVHSGKVNVKDIDFKRLLNDTIISSKKITVNDLHLLAYKDKRLPFHHGVYKPMLTDLLLNINPKILVDSVILKNGLIEYEEFNDKTQRFGQIRLSKVKGAIAGVKTFNPLPKDSLRFNIYARLIDTADLRIRYQQSYSDSLSGFHLKLIVNSFNLTALNPILRSFASAELKSGNLDTIRMSAIGRKYIAYGIMKMYYTDLNAQLLSKGDSSAKTVVTKSASFFANRIVHTKNRRGTGDVFAERDPEKGFVNYWVKIVIGGVLTNSGVRSDNKQQRKYKRALNIHDVPPIQDIPVDY